MTRGLTAAGVHVPRFRIESSTIGEAWGVDHASGIERKALPAADEDAVTMAISAARDALDRGNANAADLSFVGLATTTPPLAEEELAPRVVRALGGASDARTATATASPLAGLDVLERAVEADGPALAIAADAPTGDPAEADHRLGAGAVAFLVDDDAPVTLVDSAAHSDEYPGVRYRERGSEEVDALGVTTYERDAVGESVAAVVSDLDVSEPAGAALHQPNGGLPHRAGGRTDIAGAAIERGTVVDRVGDAGAATVPLGLCAALASADADDATVAVDFGGGGGALGLAFAGGLDNAPSVDERLSGGELVSYDRYLRERGYVVDGEVAGGGAHVSLPSWRRSLDGRYRLVAGRCPSCGGLTFPAEGACGVCHDRGAFEHVELPREGVVDAVTVIGQGGAPPEFVPQQERDGPYAVAIVRFTHSGEEVTIPMQLTDCDPETVAVGDDVRATIRRVYADEGIPRYGSKATPI